MELILIVIVFVFMISCVGLYMYLVDQEKIEPYIPAPVKRDEREQIHRGNFWDYKTKKYYKWDELMELHEQRRKGNEST